MGNSAQAVTDEQGKKVEPTVTFQEKVNEATEQLTRDGNGHWVVPEGVELDEAVHFAAVSEKRRRSAQSKLAKTSTELAISKEANTSLTKLVKKTGKVQLTADQQTELDELKFSDPDAWRTKVNELENNVTTETDTTLQTINDDAIAKGSIGDREVILHSFLQDNPGLSITDKVIENDVPPRITKKLEAGETTFLEFLTEVKDYLKAGKVVKSDPASDDPNLTKIGGSDSPTAAAQQKADETTYENAIF